MLHSEHLEDSSHVIHIERFISFSYILFYIVIFSSIYFVLYYYNMVIYSYLYIFILYYIYVYRITYRGGTGGKEELGERRN